MNIKRLIKVILEKLRPGFDDKKIKKIDKMWFKNIYQREKYRGI